MMHQESASGSRVTLHMVSSLDGFIARKDNSVSWLEEDGTVYEAGTTFSAEEAAAFVRTIDCYVMGSHTYEHALELGWPYGDTPVVVLTNRRLTAVKPTVEFCSGEIEAVVTSKLAPRFRNIWLVGGAHLCHRFLELGLVDDIRLTMAPVLLGDGLRLFGRMEEQRWHLKNVSAYRNGFVELSYATAARAHPRRT
jgi:dihydrofolate reductase